jgi:hypothetical protein
MPLVNKAFFIYLAGRSRLLNHAINVAMPIERKATPFPGAEDFADLSGDFSDLMITPPRPTHHGGGAPTRWFEEDVFCDSPSAKTPSPPRSTPAALGGSRMTTNPVNTFDSSPLSGQGLTRRQYMRRRAGPRPLVVADHLPIRSAKKALSVDSPAFTPATLPVPGKTSTISSQAANAAPFTPRGLASGK